MLRVQFEARLFDSLNPIEFEFDNKHLFSWIAFKLCQGSVF